MAKSKPLHWQEPETIKCPQCKGTGEWIGMFGSAPCAMCYGAGLVGTDGEPLPPEDLLAMMRRQRDRAVADLESARQHYRQLLQIPGVREALAAQQQREEERQRDEDMALRKRMRGG